MYAMGLQFYIPLALALRYEIEVMRLEAAAAAERSWALAPLLCRDGALSPSCRCGRGSYRGCCSHHLGVAGCSATR